MAQPDQTLNLELIAAASKFAEDVKTFNGDPVKQRQLLKEADRLRLMLETPMDVLMYVHLILLFAFLTVAQMSLNGAQYETRGHKRHSESAR